MFATDTTTAFANLVRARMKFGDEEDRLAALNVVASLLGEMIAIHCRDNPDVAKSTAATLFDTTRRVAVAESMGLDPRILEARWLHVTGPEGRA